jgi:CubicO group peptidase (beta-lactamase class C family)
MSTVSRRSAHLRNPIASSQRSPRMVAEGRPKGTGPPSSQRHGMNRAACLLLPLLLLAAPPGRPAAGEDPWAALDAVAGEAVTAGNVPGVVLLVNHRGRTVYRKAFGRRAVEPEPQPMTLDTVFDLASLTKPVATGSSIMALIEEGRLRLRDPVALHWPEFGANGKDKVTIRQLLTHSSGLASWENYQRRFGDAAGPAIQERTPQVLAALAERPLANPPDTRFTYSDLGYITLGEVVRRVSGEPLDRYAARRIFAPLRMRDTGFNPPPGLQARAAPTEKWNGLFRRGQVHDPNAAVMDGVAGHAGLFSTADDLARYGRMLLSSDGERGRFPLSPATIRVMTTAASAEGLPKRALGWDVDSGYSHVRGDLLPVGSFGHTGFTGTFMWVDPYSRTFIIGLSNRVHPAGGGSPLGLWAKAANVVAGIVRPQVLPPRAPGGS